MVEKETLNAIIQEALDFVMKRISIDTAVLFGSFAVGKPHEYSDIDLAVFSRDIENWTTEQKIELAVELKRDCCPDVELHLYGASALIEARPSNFYGYLLKTGRKIA